MPAKWAYASFLTSNHIASVCVQACTTSAAYTVAKGSLLQDAKVEFGKWANCVMHKQASARLLVSQPFLMQFKVNKCRTILSVFAKAATTAGSLETNFSLLFEHMTPQRLPVAHNPLPENQACVSKPGCVSVGPWGMSKS